MSNVTKLAEGKISRLVQNIPNLSQVASPTLALASA